MISIYSGVFCRSKSKLGLLCRTFPSPSTHLSIIKKRNLDLNSRNTNAGGGAWGRIAYVTPSLSDKGQVKVSPVSPHHDRHGYQHPHFLYPTPDTTSPDSPQELSALLLPHPEIPAWQLFSITVSSTTVRWRVSSFVNLPVAVIMPRSIG